VSANPTRVWVSLDGPREINDAQRGAGVYDRATRGIDAIDRLKRETGDPYPELGVTFVVTPDNHHTIEDFFLELDLSRLNAVSIEMQNYVTAEQHRHYARVAHEKFGVTSTPSAAGYVRDPALFANVDAEAVACQMRRVRDECRERGIRFFSMPHTLESETIAAYLSADWTAMADHHQRCAVPWMYAEISARGDVTTCHTFYDLTIGNIYDRSLIDIWRGERAAEVRSHLRRELFSICTACPRYYLTSPDPIDRTTARRRNES
jgi:radical SAM protein with 4Fe4S-binding SPASM domain